MDSLWDVEKSNKLEINSLFSKSSAGPSFKTKPYSSQNSLYLSNDKSFKDFKDSNIFLVTPFLIVSTRGCSWSISLETFNGKSPVSIIPLTNLKYKGRKLDASSIIKTLCIYNFIPFGDSLFHKSKGGLDGTYNKLVYSFFPSTLLWAHNSGSTWS